MSGRTEESGTGVFGIYLRSIADQVQNLGSETAAQRQLQSFNTPGTGRYDLGNSAEAVDPVTIKNSFNLHERLKLPPAGSAGIPYGMPLLVRPGNFLLNSRLSGRKSAFPCYAGRQTEDFEVTFEPGLPLPNPLISRAINNPAFTYRSSFKLEDRTLKIHREFTSGVSGQSCQPELEARLGDDMNRVRLNMINAFDFGSVASSEPAKQRQTTEVTRVVPADQKRRIDFLYWIDPDCSSPELPTVHIAEQPRNGKLVIEHGTGFTNFPQDNPRYECNKRKSEGVSLVYEPDMRFIGTDSITVDVILPSGRSIKRHYSIEVKAVESVSSVPNSRQTN